MLGIAREVGAIYRPPGETRNHQACGIQNGQGQRRRQGQIRNAGPLRALHRAEFAAKDHQSPSWLKDRWKPPMPTRPTPSQHARGSILPNYGVSYFAACALTHRLHVAISRTSLVRTDERRMAQFASRMLRYRDVSMLGVRRLPAVFQPLGDG